ncbi:MAG: ATP-NAD kinase family protein [Nitrososphaerota archaeon]|nr:ATP-NAD kinase family protein [Nitrososphaerales archaeon]MDW8044449.1 ATP-NAD kinase family protein [Nitrososphaerota archaeon]
MNSNLNKKRKRLGFIVNPYAGMGGRVGLKGTDGDALQRALALGAEPVAPRRAVKVLEEIRKYNLPIEIITYPYEMGEYEAIEAGFVPKVIGSIESGRTTALDTIRAAREIADMGVELLVFVGGDGTARDILNAIDLKLTVLGVPSGVKTYSSVFAINPSAAALIVRNYLRGELSIGEGEVLDIDEDAYRNGILKVRLYGYLNVPIEADLMQSSKSFSSIDEKDNQRAIAKYVIEEMEDGVIYIVGPGTTTYAICEALGIEKTLLGVDIIYNKRLLYKDVDEKSILKAIEGEGKRAKIIVTPIGRQGFIFGRGNQQISPEIIRKVGRENVIVIATHRKLSEIKKLYIDTGDEEVDDWFKGYIRVITDYREESIVPCD